MRYDFQNNMLRKNQFRIWSYLNKVTDDWYYKNNLATWFDIYPEISLQIIEDYFKPNNKKLNKFIGYMLSKSLIGFIVGMRGSGKTRLLYFLAEILQQEGKIICFVNFQEDDLEGLPKSFPYLQKENVQDCPQNSVIFFDEYATINKEWNSKENKENTSEMAVARHKNKSVIYCAQTMSSFPIDILRFSDFGLYKKFSLKQLSSDRQEFLNHIENFIPTQIEEVLFESNEFFSFFSNPLPSWELC